MSSFEGKHLDVPQSRFLNLLSGSLVLVFGSIGGTYLFGWLLLA
jgi:hypothetical protein